jgi:predicted house-cleaning noncanonical NTP pyrophosphatase (MazG superfamily)
LDHQTFQDELDKALSEILLAELYDYLDHRFDSYEQSVRYISALDRKYEGDAVVREGLPNVLNSIKDRLASPEKSPFHECYRDAVEQLDHFPDTVSWSQPEARFATMDEDSLPIRTAKNGKRIARSLSNGWHRLISGGQNYSPEWTHEVPLQSFVQHQLFDAALIQPTVDALERARMTIITDIEEWLVKRCKGEAQESLGDFADSLEEKIKEKRGSAKEQVSQILEQKKVALVTESHKVGTVEHSPRSYTTERLKDSKETFSTEMQDRIEEWISAEQLLLNRTRDVGQFLNFLTEITSEVADFKTDVESLFQDNLSQPLSELEQKLDSAIEDIGRGDVSSEVSDVKNELGLFVDQRLVQPVQILLEKQVMSSKVEHFFESLLLTAGQTSAEAQLLFDFELEKNPPKLNEKQIDWRQLVIRVMREQLINPLQQDNQQYEVFWGATLEEIREIENIIDVNLESALAAEDAHIDEEVEHPAKIARESLERIRAKVDVLDKRSFEKWQSINQRIQEGQEKLQSSLLELLHEGSGNQLQLLNAKYKVKETTKDWRTVMDSRLARSQDQLALWWRFVVQKSKTYTQQVRDFAGLKEPKVVETKRADIATYLSETDEKMKNLPYIYRRLFNFDAVADERFFVPASETTTTFKKALTQWQESYPATFAIVGEKGSGKSTFLNRMVEAHLQEEKIIPVELKTSISTEKQLIDVLGTQLNYPDVTSAEELVDAVNNQEKRQTVIMEGVQNAFVRTINGYEAIEKLCYIIAETKNKLFWAVSCSRYAWRFLDKVVQGSEYFSHIATTDSLDAQQIKSVIMNRHRSSGYSLVFEANANIQQARSYRKLQDQQEEAQQYLMDRYFEELTKLAEGNASVAMIFWIRSIRDYDDTYFYIQPLEVTSVEMIEQLSTQVLFTLAAFVLHDTLIDEDLAKIMGITVQESRLLINRLQSRGLLVQKDGTYTINHLMYRQIVWVLKDRNIIHLV